LNCCLQNSQTPKTAGASLRTIWSFLLAMCKDYAVRADVQALRISNCTRSILRTFPNDNFSRGRSSVCPLP
jgi:hypothetical protein